MTHLLSSTQVVRNLEFGVTRSDVELFMNQIKCINDHVSWNFGCFDYSSCPAPDFYDCLTECPSDSWPGN